MTVMDLLGVVGNGKIHITEATYNMPRLFYGDRKDIPPTLHYTKVKNIAPGMLYNNFARFITIEDRRYSQDGGGPVNG